MPIYQVSTYKQEAIGKHKGFEYSRTGNPTRHALETYIAELEGGARGLALGSGMAALSTILSQFNKGDHLVVGDDVYGGTYRVVTRVFTRLGLEATYVDTSNLAAVEAAIRPETKAIIMETPTNPLLK
ncbi:PLP-dependent transferase, partial [Frankia sp. Cpl3]|nr:PLP-dependent transferase [Frankia sp. Cpl3]